MWRKQIRAERAAEQASQILAKANVSKAASLDRPGSSGNEGSPSEDVSENEAENRSPDSSGDDKPVGKTKPVEAAGARAQPKQADHD